MLAMTAAPLKLRATDADDMRVIAAVLQDALVPLSDVVYQPRERRFVMVANRFCWESEGIESATLAEAGADPAAGPEDGERDAAFHEGSQGGPLFERVNCGLRVERVKAVRRRGIDPKERDQILNLLTIDAGPGAITFVFSGGAAIRLEVAAISCHLEDIGEPWPTAWRPTHALDAADLEG